MDVLHPPPAPAQPRVHPTRLYRCCRILIRCLCRLYFNWEVRGTAHVPASGPILLAANHLSYLDPPLIGAALDREVHFLARKSLFDGRCLARIITHLNALPIDRDGGGGAGLRNVLEYLDRNVALILFPEGTRSPDGRLQIPKPGIGLTVVRSGVPVFPVHIHGTFQALGKRHILPRPCKVRIHFGPQVPLDDLLDAAHTADHTRLKVLYQEIADRIVEAIRTLEP